MEATELRIGNKVDLYGQVATIQKRDFSVGFAITEGKPIPLTEEWLKKYGFERTPFGRKLDDFCLEAGSMVVKTGELRGFSYELIPEEKYINVNYVHRLQNLYFALTENELILNIKK